MTHVGVTQDTASSSCSLRSHVASTLTPPNTQSTDPTLLNRWPTSRPRTNDEIAAVVDALVRLDFQQTGSGQIFIEAPSRPKSAPFVATLSRSDVAFVFGLSHASLVRVKYRADVSDHRRRSRRLTKVHPQNVSDHRQKHRPYLEPTAAPPWRRKVLLRS